MNFPKCFSVVFFFLINRKKDKIISNTFAFYGIGNFLEVYGYAFITIMIYLQNSSILKWKHTSL